MLRSQRLALIAFPFLLSFLKGQSNSPVWKEYGFISDQVLSVAGVSFHAYKFQDLTGALAAWESMRSPEGKSCSLAPICSKNGDETLISVANYVVKMGSSGLTGAKVATVLDGIPDKHETSLPAILTFLPQKGLVPNSTRYLLGPESLKAYAPELGEAKPGFEQGAEAQIGSYKIGPGVPIRLGLFYYPTPEMARLHSTDFKMHVGPHVKRSGVLVAVVYGQASDEATDTLLSRIGYEAKITWNDMPPPNPVKPLYQLLVNIAILSGILAALCITAGLFYAGMRVYRRRYGTLESEEAMTSLNLSGE